MRKAIITVAVSILTVLLQGYVYADNNQALSNPGKLDEVSVGKIVPNELDNSNLLVEVTLTTSSGESSVIYTGVLSGYDEEMLEYVDFSDVDAVILFDWDSSDMICIKPIAKLNEESISDSISTTQKDSATVLNTSRNSMSISDDWSIASQIKINGVNVGENGLRIVDNANLSCTFNLTNESNTSKSFASLLVTYDESGRMQNVKTAEVVVAAGETENIQILYQFEAEKEYVGKLMMWDSLAGMIPLRTTINFTQTSGVNAYYYNTDNRLLQVDKIDGTSLMYTYDNMGNLLTRTVR